MSAKITVYKKCPVCGQEYKVTVPLDGYRAWRAGELMQDAMPFVSPTARECLISAECPDCQSAIFNRSYDSPEVEYIEKKDEDAPVFHPDEIPSVGDFGELTGAEILEMLRSALKG